MAVKLVGPVSVPHRHDRPCWRLVKGQRCALAVIREYVEIANARELRIAVDGELRWSKLVRGAGLEELSASMRADFERLGWSAAE